MIWDLTFSKALVLFTIIMTPFYLALLMFSERIVKKHRESADDKTLSIIIISLFLMEILALSLLGLTAFRTIAIGFILPPLIAGLLLCTLYLSSGSDKIQPLILVSVILYHVVVLYPPTLGVSINERTAAMAKLNLDGRYDPSWDFLNPVYDPFPMDLSLFNIVSMITSFPLTSQLNDWVVYLPFIVAYDLVLYNLTKRVTGSQVAGVFAIFILASTPPANILSHGPKWIGNLLMLISVLILIKAFDGFSVPNMVVANISYVGAIFFHPSAAIGAFLPPGMIMLGYLAKRVIKGEVWANLSKSQLFRMAFTLFALITLARAVNTAGYLGQVLPALRSFILTMLGYTPASEAATPVYDLSVDAIQAYAWSTLVALASALIVHSILKRKIIGSAFVPVMYFVGAAFSSLGLLIAMIRAGGFQGAMYPALVLLIPAAAATGERILKSSRIVSIIAIALLVLSVRVAMSDPMISHIRTWSGDVTPKMEDYIEARFLVKAVPTHESLITSYEIGSSFGYLEVIENIDAHKYYVAGADLLRIEVKHMIESHNPREGVTYIWPEWWYPGIKSYFNSELVNVLYDSSRYVIFKTA